MISSNKLTVTRKSRSALGEVAEDFRGQVLGGQPVEPCVVSTGLQGQRS